MTTITTEVTESTGGFPVFLCGEEVLICPAK
jgi:hypothetical protein